MASISGDACCCRIFPYHCFSSLIFSELLSFIDLIMASNQVYCIICKETEEDKPGLNLFSRDTLDTAKKTAARLTP